MNQLVECVPNFSEGRDLSRVEAIISAMATVPAILILDRHIDRDHNRSVVSIAGEPDVVAESVLRGIGKAAELIDLTKQSGAHPRIGATDVVPFVPIRGITLAECADLAKRVGDEIWRRYRIPVYFYEAAAQHPERVHLENIRRGQFEKLRLDAVRDPARAADVGGPELHPTAGAIIVGARKFLIAYNINLESSELEIAERIARKIRFSSGGLRFVKAMAVKLRSRGLVQVSMNLTDFEQTPVHRVYEAVKQEAKSLGVDIAGSEIVGLIPSRAMAMTAEFFLQLDRFSPIQVLETRIEESLLQTRSGAMEPPLTDATTLAALAHPLLSAIAKPDVPRGGGSAVSLTAALAASVGEMIAGALLQENHASAADAALRQAAADFHSWASSLAAAADRDASSHGTLLAARRTSADSEKDRLQHASAIERALHAAIEASLDVARRAANLLDLLGQLEMLGGSSILTDVQVGRLLAAAAVRGALLDLSVHLETITDADLAARVRAECETIASRSNGGAISTPSLVEVPK